MHDQTGPKLSKWPFFLGDALLLGAGWFISFKLPMGMWQAAFVVLCAAGAACLGVLPFLLEYRVFVKLTEARGLATVVSQLDKLEEISAKIGGATSQWQAVHEEAGKTAKSARNIADRMTAEVTAFAEFMQHANDGEKATLRVEVEKMHRAEAEWLQTLVRILDHVYALNQGARRSGQANLIEQMGNFQNACRDAARRVGLTPFTANPGEPLDAKRHQLAEGNGKLPDGAQVGDTLATGYTLQGKQIRPALVRLLEKNGNGTSDSQNGDIKTVTVQRGAQPQPA
jgi:molecular chaperone GrpE (heat shock protein)